MNNLKEMSIEDLLEELVLQGRYKQIYSGFGDRGSGEDINKNIEAIKLEITNRFYDGSKFTCALN